MKNLAFLAVCNHFGGQKKTAEAMGCTSGFIGHIVNGRRPMPIDWAPKIEAITGGKFTCEELAPNFPWAIVREGGSKSPAKR